MLHSCLSETIKTAIERFEQMGLLEMTAYATKKGNTTVFLRAAAESKTRIGEQLALFSAHRNFSKAEQQGIFGEIDQVLMRTQGPIPGANASPKL